MSKGELRRISLHTREAQERPGRRAERDGQAKPVEKVIKGHGVKEGCGEEKKKALNGK